MSSNKPVLIYIAFFVILIVLLSILDVINPDVKELISYGLILYGLARVYLSFGTGKKLNLFLGTIFFFLGLIFFLTSRFDFYEPYKLAVPSFMFIIGAGFLVLFIDDTSSKVLIIIAAIFMLIGIAAALFLGSSGLTSYFQSFYLVLKVYWQVVLVLVVIILLFRKKKD